MDINSIYILLKTHQKEDNSVTCYWDFSDAAQEDNEGNVWGLIPREYSLEALHAPDPKNPLLTRLPGELQFEKEERESEVYKSKNGYFTIGELLEAIRSFVEVIYNEKYSNGKYTFKNLYFEGISGSCKLFEIKMVIADNDTMNTFYGMEQLMDMIGEDM